jgi:transcriptional regulator with XRE-family HTH domain
MSAYRLKLVWDHNSAEYEQDIRFGSWLRAQRIRLNLSLPDVQQATSISIRRIIEIEAGSGIKGVTTREVRLFSGAYKIADRIILDQLFDRVNGPNTG